MGDKALIILIVSVLGLHFLIGIGYLIYKMKGKKKE